MSDVTNSNGRIFKIGNNQVFEDESTAQLTNEQVRSLLRSTYPEVANAVIQERTEGDRQVVEFLAQPGKKG